MERRTRDEAPGGAGRTVSGVARKPGWPWGPGERGREGRLDRGRVPLSASQRLRLGGFPGADGISAQRLAKAWLLLCFRIVKSWKSHQTVTASFAAKQRAPANPL